MSLILDALKKSEAERQLGRAPGLLTPAPTVGRRHGLAALVAAVVVAVGLSVGLTWWLLRPAEPLPPPAVASGTPTGPSRSGDPAPAAAPADQAPPRPAQPTAAVASNAPAAVPPAPATARAAGPAPMEEPTRERERESLAQPAGEALPLPAPPAAVAPAPPRAADDAAAVPAADGDAADDAGPPLPQLRDLPPDLRAALPPLRLSMHVFNDDPAQRFVLIDGRRYGEGAALAEGLVLEAIRRDGVVLLFRERRFLLQRPG